MIVSPETITIVYQPEADFLIKDACVCGEDAEHLDFEYVQVANCICCAFVKKHPVCMAGQRIIFRVIYTGTRGTDCWVKMRGIMVKR